MKILKTVLIDKYTSTSDMAEKFEALGYWPDVFLLTQQAKADMTRAGVLDTVTIPRGALFLGKPSIEFPYAP